MFESRNSSKNYKTFKISIGELIKNPAMLIFVPDQLKTKKMFKNAVKKLTFLLFFYYY